MVHNVLHPGKVGITSGRHAILPAHVLTQAVAAPIRNVKGRVGEDEIGLEVAKLVLVEAALAVPLNLGTVMNSVWRAGG